jgi:hypothetical protein
MRRLFRSAVVLLLLIGGAALAVQAYLSSDAATARVAARVSAALGTRVTIGGIALGIGGSTLTDMVIEEADSAAGGPPLATVKRVETDIGIRELISGPSDPTKITLDGLQLLVRHDRAGRLLTRLPRPADAGKPTPTIRVANAGVTIRKDGEPDVRFDGFQGQVAEQNGQIRLTGELHDPTWGGQWHIDATAPKAGGTVGVSVKSAGVHVTQKMLRRAPYVAESIWNHVTLEGRTPVDLRLVIPPAPAKTSYRVVLTPVDTAVYVPSIDLHAAAAAGHVVVEDGLVTLRDVRGRVAEGELHVMAAELDFRPPNMSILKFELDATRLLLKALPSSWRLPPRLGGRLSGKATLVVRIVEGIPLLSGSGEGLVADAFIGPIPVPNYGLRIRADRNGFLFEPRIGR